VVNPRVRVHRDLLGRRLRFGLHSHLSPSVSRPPAGHITHAP
jgi:hypothetical protein